jgi:hypothetical protein
MTTYVRGIRVWHITDKIGRYPGATRPSHICKCGAFTPVGPAPVNAPSDEDPVCPVCLKAPTDAQKRAGNRIYAQVVPKPANT